MAENEPFAFLFWITLKNFIKNNCQKICTIQKFVVPLHRFSPLYLDEGQWTMDNGRK